MEKTTLEKQENIPRRPKRTTNEPRAGPSLFTLLRRQQTHRLAVSILLILLVPVVLAFQPWPPSIAFIVAIVMAAIVKLNIA